jgi:hypothetical protein
MQKTKGIPKYGMSYCTIWYFQDQARMLQRHCGVHAGRSILTYKGYLSLTSQEIAYAAISFAEVASKDELVAILSN